MNDTTCRTVAVELLNSMYTGDEKTVDAAFLLLADGESHIASVDLVTVLAEITCYASVLTEAIAKNNDEDRDLVMTRTFNLMDMMRDAS